MILPLTCTTEFGVVMVTVGVGTESITLILLAWQQDQVLLTLNDHTAIFSDY